MKLQPHFSFFLFFLSIFLSFYLSFFLSFFLSSFLFLHYYFPVFGPKNRRSCVWQDLSSFFYFFFDNIFTFLLESIFEKKKFFFFLIFRQKCAWQPYYNIFESIHFIYQFLLLSFWDCLFVSIKVGVKRWHFIG